MWLASFVQRSQAQSEETIISGRRHAAVPGGALVDVTIGLKGSDKCNGFGHADIVALQFKIANPFFKFKNAGLVMKKMHE